MKITSPRVPVLISLLVLVFFLALFTSSAFAAESFTAKAVFVEGDVTYKVSGSNDWKPLQVNTPLNPGDQARSGKNSYFAIMLTDGTRFRFNQQAHVVIKGGKSETLLQLIVGELWANVSKTGIGKMIETRYTAIKITGTELDILESKNNDIPCFLSLDGSR